MQSTNDVDGEKIPVRHFGAILDVGLWKILAEKLKRSGVEFLVEPSVRFKGLSGEQWTMFVKDPSGNALEFKSFADDAMVFAR